MLEQEVIWTYHDVYSYGSNFEFPANATKITRVLITKSKGLQSFVKDPHHVTQAYCECVTVFNGWVFKNSVRLHNYYGLIQLLCFVFLTVALANVFHM